MEDVVRKPGHVVGPSLREAASKSAVPAMSGAYLIGAWSFLMRKTSWAMSMRKDQLLNIGEAILLIF